MVNVHDVAAAIVVTTGPITAMKMQKLAYYTKAWHVVRTGVELFPEHFEAWRTGPVCRQLYEHHRGVFSVSHWRDGNHENLAADERSTVASVVEIYGPLPARQMVNLAHTERPWVLARGGIASHKRCTNVITLDSMREYYSTFEIVAVRTELH